MSSELWKNKRIKHIKAHSGYSKHLLPSETLNCLLPGHTFLKGTYYFIQIFQTAKMCLQYSYFEEQIHWVPLIFGHTTFSFPFLPPPLTLQIRAETEQSSHFRGKTFSKTYLKLNRSVKPPWHEPSRTHVVRFVFALQYEVLFTVYWGLYVTLIV